MGITQFSSSLSARRRWMVTHSVRSKIVSFMLNKAGMNPSEDTVQEARPSRVRRDRKDLDCLIQGITNTMNPFSTEVNDDELYCISTGKTMPKDISDDMTSILQKGQLWMEEFKRDCFADSSRFEKPIKRRKVKNFAQATVSSTVTTKDKQVRQLKCSRDLFGRLLYLATEMDIDLRKVFTYPLTPVPLSVSHIDGTMVKTNKSKLMKKLQSMIESVPPGSIDVTIVDAMFFIQSLMNLPNTFGGVAKVILSILARLSNRIDFVADTYKSPTVKDNERTSRDSGYDTKITGPEQRRPNDFQKTLKSSSFKESLLKFLSEEWRKDEYAIILRTSKLYFGFSDCCYLYEVSSGKTKRTEIATLACVHEEADTRVVWHLKHCAEQESRPNIVVRCSDTDVLIVLLFHVNSYNVSLWMDVGNDGNNNRRYISITQLSSHLGADVCRALPGIHAYTGCDYTAAFSRKGKVRPFEIALKSKRYLEAFGKLGISHELEDKTAADLESFVCALYGKPRVAKVNEARLSIFRTKYAPSTTEQPLAKLKGADPSLLPPPKPVLHQKLLRSNFVAYTWKHADRSVPCELLPTECGWVLENGTYQIVWYDGPQLPDDIYEDIHKIDIDSLDNEPEDEDDTSSDDSDDTDDIENSEAE